MTTATTLTIPAKLDLLEQKMQTRAYERGTEATVLVTCLVARGHVVMVGPPGIAKSLLVNAMVARLGMTLEEYFHWSIDRFTVPENVFGIYSLKGMENDEFRRNTAYKMPRSKITNLEEIFKGSNALLNTWLTMLNEGIFFNGSTPTLCRPLIMGTSNELPTGTEMAALVDRITCKLMVKPMISNDSVRAMLRDIADRRRNPEVVEQILTWAEIEEAQNLADMVEVPDEVIEALVELKVKLKREGIEPTDRHFGDCMKLIQATAYRHGRSVADVEDMTEVRHALWVAPADIAKVDELVLALASPLDNEAMKLIAEVDNLAAELNKMIAKVDNDQQRRRQGVQLNSKMARLGKDLDALQAKAKNKNTTRSTKINEARARLRELIKTLLALYSVTDKNASA